MFPGRRLTFQLTPLLDLLLIVIFAQYMEVRDTSTREVAEIAQRRAAVDQEISDARKQFEREIDQRRDRINEELDQALKQQAQVGDLIAELFRIPESLVEQVLKPGPLNPGVRNEQEMSRLRAMFNQMGKRRGRDAVRHILTHEELLKRVDVWNVYLSETGQVTLRVDDQSHTFRFRSTSEPRSRTQAELDAAQDAAAEKFSTQIYEFFKTSLPQPKSVVIMLFSYDKDVTVFWQKPAMLGMREAAARMRADSNGRTRFEYAVLGILENGG